MKIFDQTKDWPNKVNFVDENNVFVGYDMSQDCCEYAGWYIIDNINSSLIPYLRDDMFKFNEDVKYIKHYVFDTSFFKEILDCESTDQGGVVIFRLVPKDPDADVYPRQKFLHLFNVQNGYYGHGFEFKIGEEIIREGSL